MNMSTDFDLIDLVREVECRLEKSCASQDLLDKFRDIREQVEVELDLEDE